MRRPVSWRYAVLGAAFLGLAGVRAVQGAPVWAVVFAAAAAVNVWLALHEGPRRAPQEPQEPQETLKPERAEVEASLAGHRASAHQWQVIATAGVLVGGLLLPLEPALAPFAAGAALFALHRARRSQRTAATLRRLTPVRR